MIHRIFNCFREIWCVDFEYSQPTGENPDPVCMVAYELNSGKELKVWQDELQNMRKPPYSVGKDSLFVAYYASAEMSCHLALDWPMPENILDLYTEFRNLTNGLSPEFGNTLLGALKWFGLVGIETTEKEKMRELAMRGGLWSSDEQISLLDYCESDVQALVKLLLQMLKSLDTGRALLRGRYMKAAASIEHNGIPIDTPKLNQLHTYKDRIKSRLIEKVDANYGVYQNDTFKIALFTDWINKNKIPWPQLPSGVLDTKDDTFKDMANTYPEVAPLHQLRKTLSTIRSWKLSVGSDGRNRCLLSAFSSVTGRNQPSNSKFVFGLPNWVRGLIRPEPGTGLAYIDWSQQEFGIAAALSEDPLMMEAYMSGDSYLTFAIQAGEVPSGATKETHSKEREKFKLCVLGVQYGMGSKSLAIRINQPEIYAKELLLLHRKTYKNYWRWSDSAVGCAMLYGNIGTVFGWNINASANTKPRTLRNFPMQANGAEMLRLACCLAVEQGIRVCAPVHDALLIESPLDELDDAISKTQQIMSYASALVLGGFGLRSDVKKVYYPDRYVDERGQEMWKTVWELISEVKEHDNDDK